MRGIGCLKSRLPFLIFVVSIISRRQAVGHFVKSEEDRAVVEIVDVDAPVAVWALVFDVIAVDWPDVETTDADFAVLLVAVDWAVMESLVDDGAVPVPVWAFVVDAVAVDWAFVESLVVDVAVSVTVRAFVVDAAAGDWAVLEIDVGVRTAAGALFDIAVAVDWASRPILDVKHVIVNKKDKFTHNLLFFQGVILSLIKNADFTCFHALKICLRNSFPLFFQTRHYLLSIYHH